MPASSPNKSLVSRMTIFISLIIGVLLAGCATEPQQQDNAGADSDTDAEGANGEELTIGVSFRTQRQGRWVFERQAIQQHAEELGVNIVAQDANEDPQIQASQVENMITRGIDALILGAVDAGAAEQLVTTANNAGIPVIAYDTPIDDARLDHFVTRNNVEVGEMQAEMALEYSDGGDWAILKGDASAGVAREIAEGYDNVLATPIEDGDINVVLDQFVDQWSSETAQSNAENVITRYEDTVQVFLTSSDGLGFGTVRALSGTPLEGEVFVSGLDGEPANLQLIADGKQTMSVWADLETWAETALEVAVALATGEEPEVDGMTEVSDGEIPSSFVPIKAITQENVCDFVTEEAPDGWADKDEVFANNPDMCP